MTTCERWAFWMGTCVASALFSVGLNSPYLAAYNLALLALYIYLYQKAKKSEE